MRYLIPFAATAMLMLAGCSLLGPTADSEAATDELNVAVSQLQAANDALAAERSRLEALRAQALVQNNPAAVAGVDAQLSQAAKAQRAVDAAGKVAALAQNPDDPEAMSGVAGLAGAALGPWGILGATVLTGVWREYKNRQKIMQTSEAATSIVNALDAARAASPALKEAMAAQKGTIESQTTPLAKEIIAAERIT
jgi:hypothetical protein